MNTPALPTSARAKPGGGLRKLAWTVVGLLTVVAICGEAAVYFGLFARTEQVAWLTEPVTRGDLVVTVTEDGTLESARNLDVKCEVAGGSTILWIVKDGTEVKHDEELVRLDSSTIEETINTQTIAYEKALAASIESEKTFQAAKIAVQEYLEGTFPKEMQTVEANITIAMENLRNAENSLTHAERMARRGYITSLKRDAQAFAVEKAKLDLQVAETAKTVLGKFTKAKMLVDLESKRDAAEALMRSNKAAVELEEAKLKRLQLQLEKCIIKAPKNGLVIYANEQGGWRGGQQTSAIEEGASVRERQSILRLPDLLQMQAKVLIHESKVDDLQEGMRAKLRIQGRDYQGTVYSIANQAEQSNWFSSGAKKFSTIVRIDGSPPDLLPGMTATVTVLIASKPQVLSVPTQALVEGNGEILCWVGAGGRAERRVVKVGQRSLQRVEVLSGVKEGDQVILDPKNSIAEAKLETREVKELDVKQQFGIAPGADYGRPPVAGAAPKARGGPGARPGRPGGPAPAPTAQAGPIPVGIATAGPEPPDAAQTDGARGSGAAKAFDPLQFDKDGDRRLSSSEAPEPLQRLFERGDANHDGYLDTQEIAALRRAMRPPSARGPSEKSSPPTGS